MHDPHTLIGSFWIIDLWHKDPESDGTDNSCGWTHPKLTDKELNNLKVLAKTERQVYKYAQPKWEPTPFNIIYSAYMLVLWQVFRKKITAKDLVLIHNLVCDPWDNLCSYCDLDDDYSFNELIHLIARQIKRIQRPWYKHPRFHIHHWRITIRKNELKYWIKGLR